MATYNSAGSGNFNVDATWTETGHPSTGDTAVIASGHTVTMTADDAVGSIDIQGTLTTDGTARTLTLDANAQGYICEHRGTVSTTINLVINSDFAGDKLIRLNNGGNGNFNDVSITLQSTSRKLTIGTEAASIDGDLTLTQGIFDTDSSNNYALTVDGTTTIGPNSGAADQATLTCNASTVSLGAAYTSGYALDVKRGGTFNGGSGNHTSGALKVTTDSNTNAKLDLTSANHTITSEYTSENRFFELTSGTVTHSDGTIILDDAVTAEIQWTATTGDNGPYNLTLNDSGMTVSGRSALTVLNNFTLTAGTYTTHSPGGGADKDLTVNGRTYVQGGTLNCNSSTISLKSGVNNNLFGLYVSIGTFNGGTGTHTIGGIRVSGGTLTLTSGNTTINAGETSSSAGAIYISGSPTVNTSNGTVIIDTSSTLQFLLYNSNLTLHNLTINSGSTIRLWQPTSDGSGTELLTVTGDLTINGGLDTDFSSQDDVNLTVAGELNLNGGTLTCNDSDVIVRNIYASGGTLSAPSNSSTNGLEVTGKGDSGSGDGYSIRIEGGTFTDNNGTVILSADSNTFMRIESSFHNFIIRNDGSSTTRTHEFINPTTIGGDLTLTNGSLQSYNTTWNINVTGEVLITKGQLGRDSATYNSSFGSLTIENDGTYVATSGTTTLTGGASLTANRCIKVSTNGTFTHNGGTLNVTGTDWGGTNFAHLWVPDGFDFGNVTLNAGGADAKYYQFREGSGTMHFDDLYVKSGELRDYNNNNTFNIRGNVDVGTKGTGGTNAGFFGSDARDNAFSTKAIIHGIANVHLNGQFHVPYGSDGTDGCKVGGIRNVGGTIYGDTA